jgi:hypothetical protein
MADFKFPHFFPSLFLRPFVLGRCGYACVIDRVDSGVGGGECCDSGFYSIGC